MKDYYSHPAVSRSKLLLFKDSVKSGAYALTQEQKDTPEMMFGRAFHSYMEDEKAFNYAILDESQRPNPDKDYRDKANKEFKEAFFNANKEYITLEQLEDIKAMKLAIEELNLKATYSHEVPAYATIDGIEFKALADAIMETEDMIYIIDYKTTSDAISESNVKRAIYKYNLHVQAYHYMEVFSRHFNKPCQMYFIFVEKSAPYNTAIAYINNESLMLENAVVIWEKAVDNYKKYLSGDIKEILTFEF